MRPFATPDGLSRVLIILGALVLVSQFAVLYYHFSLYGLIGDLVAGNPVSEERFAAIDRSVTGAGAAWLVLFLVASILFLVWLVRVRTNLPAIGVRDARWGAGWAIGSWFIPIANLFIPCQVVAEIYRGSLARLSDTWRNTSAQPVIWWWILWLLFGVLGSLPNMLVETAVASPDPDRIMRLLGWSVGFQGIATLFLAIDFALFITIVRRITRNQLAKATTHPWAAAVFD